MLIPFALVLSLQLGALDILQSPISQQADRLHFLTAKWQHMLLKQQPSADLGADFSTGLGDSAPDGFSLDIPHLGSSLVSALAFQTFARLQGLTPLNLDIAAAHESGTCSLPEHACLSAAVALSPMT